MRLYHQAALDHQMAELVAYGVFYTIRSHAPPGVSRVVVTVEGRALMVTVVVRWWALLLAPLIWLRLTYLVRWQMGKLRIWMKNRVRLQTTL